MDEGVDIRPQLGEQVVDLQTGRPGWFRAYRRTLSGNSIGFAPDALRPNGAPSKMVFLDEQQFVRCIIPGSDKPAKMLRSSRVSLADTIELGSIAHDVRSGLEGRVIAATVYLSGSAKIVLEPNGLEDRAKPATVEYHDYRIAVGPAKAKAN